MLLQNTGSVHSTVRLLSRVARDSDWNGNGKVNRNGRVGMGGNGNATLFEISHLIGYVLQYFDYSLSFLYSLAP